MPKSDQAAARAEAALQKLRLVGQKKAPALQAGDLQNNPNASANDTPAALQTQEPASAKDKFPGLAERPCFGTYDAWVERDGQKLPPGVYHHGKKGEGDEAAPVDTWVCDPLRILAQTRDATSNAWGRWLEWRDADKKAHHWAMPMAALEGDSAEVRRELAHQGLRIASGRRACELLDNYLKSTIIKKRARCVERLGWHGDVYVMPTEAIGKTADVVVFQNASGAAPALSTAGTVEQWRDGVARLAAGNSRLIFALSLAFAAPLAELAGEDSGGFHLRGSSSTGKTTALRAAASAWGGPTEYVRTWRATANGLEGVAALHNDGLLILDELSQIDGKEAGQVAYMLANGTGKARASRTGSARPPARWRLMLLSAGELSLAGLMAADGRKANAGQEVRLADIPADAGAGMGLFEQLHGHATPAALAQAIKDAASQHYGAAGVEFLHRIVADRESLPARLQASVRQFVAAAVPAGAAGQVTRVAQRFALVAAAGELATEYSVTGWDVGDAAKAARACFDAWLAAFGGAGNREERALFAQVRAFFEAHGSSRFELWDAPREQHVNNRAGFYKSDNMDMARTYYVLPEAFKNELVKGYDHKWAAKTLLAGGWLEGSGGKTSRTERLPGIGPTRCYVFTRHMWSDTDKAESEETPQSDAKNGVTGATGVTASTGAGFRVTHQKAAGATGVTGGGKSGALQHPLHQPPERCYAPKASIGAGVAHVAPVTPEKSNVANAPAQIEPPPPAQPTAPEPPTKPAKATRQQATADTTADMFDIGTGSF